MNWAVSNPEDRKELRGAVLLQAEESRKQDITLQCPKQVAYCKVTWVWGVAGVCRADYLTSADQAIPDRLV